MSWVKKNNGSSSQLPIASVTSLGAVMVGAGLSVDPTGLLKTSTTTTPLSNQITGVYVVPNTIEFSVNDSNGVVIAPSSGQTVYIYYLNQVVSYPLPAITIPNSYTLRVDVSTGVFRAVADSNLLSNEIMLLKNLIGTYGFDKGIVSGALSPYIRFKKMEDYQTISPKDYTAVTLTSSVANSMQSFAFVGSELWVFDKDISSSQIYRRDPTTFNLIGTAIHHSLGYWNSCDYNSTIDCIVTGNGTGSAQYTDNKLTIYYNVSSWSSQTSLTTSNVQYIDVSLDGLNATGNNDCKVQATWGENNFGNNNIVYIVTNDGRTIRRLMLGQGANNLGNGTFTSGLSSTQFNGTYAILNVWTQNDGGGHVQDMVYYNGAIYNNSKQSIDEHQLIIWKQNLLMNGVIEKTKIIIPVYDNTTGSLSTTVDSGEAITIKDGKLYCGLINPMYYFIMDVPV